MTTEHAIAAASEALSMIGAWLVAYEVVRRFRGDAYTIKRMTYRGKGTPEKTPQFERWEVRRTKWMWAGLVLLTLGSLMRISSALSAKMKNTAIKIALVFEISCTLIGCGAFATWIVRAFNNKRDISQFDWNTVSVAFSIVGLLITALALKIGWLQISS